ncbi:MULTISPECIES: HAMP domain-containing sensor histidine kinase [unclassified Pseudodesulfovibrio]|uniref:sensor histidine kinase n=1 Tax=unclassified Pseudodesulfovibrio TaxID=2661612 RepID=UPI000FEBCAA3|nr:MULTISPECIES: HAMP domain-containing sensor histidine kinase [unclassified Pseudodesulfovibrio]MCJ2163516.1 HAMP domain-containing histidine kinase [Pseudodesulfovibrio sp. S3-i]RWU06752.1 sensor histidine kinase [Pseudodesulfovibrio sp. S3]
MLKFNIRQKIVFGIAIFTLCFGCIALLSYSNTVQLERDVLVVERADDLSNLILETRRSEKNFFLYGDKTIFSKGMKNIDDADALLYSLSSEFRQDVVKQRGIALEGDLKQYRLLLETILRNEKAGVGGSEQEAVVGALREAGQRLVENSRAIARFERASILSINHKLRTTLVLSMITIAAVIFMLVIFVSSSILHPLRRVQAATKRITLGTFVPLPVKNAHDEVQQVFVALNSMVEQLAKRQKQLVQAQKLSSIGTLASGIAHQLNNPLNNISTSCQILMEDDAPRDELANRMMQNIKQETLRARDIVKGLLEFSREREYSPAPFPLDHIVQSAVRLVSSHVPSGISVTTDIPGDIQLQVDHQRMQEAFINLIINAVQAMEQKEGAISIGAAREGDHALITVMDTGTGISKDILDRVFDPFFSTKEVGQGTGLGLYIVYGIIEKHQGSIRVESSPGKGTTFFIRLPLAKDAATC